MAIKIPRGQEDQILAEIKNALGKYQRDNPAAQIDLYRQNSVSIRIRIVDPAFLGLSKSQRIDRAWKYMESLSEDEQGEISTLLLLTPEEKKSLFANFEFEDPVPSELQSCRLYGFDSIKVSLFPLRSLEPSLLLFG